MKDENLIRKMLDKINESSLSRVWQHIQNRRPFATISLSRNDMNSEQKSEAYQTLKDKVRELGYGYIELQGGYVEGGSDIVNEQSLMIPNISEQDAIKLGSIDLGFGAQDTVLYCNGKDFLGYIITNPEIGSVGSVSTKFNYGRDKDALPMVKNAIKNYFSTLSKGSHKNRKFAFVPENIQITEMIDDKQIIL